MIHSVHTPALLLHVVRAKLAHCAADDAHLEIPKEQTYSAFTGDAPRTK